MNIKESNLNIKIIEYQIKICESQIEYLLYHKPYWFQKEKLKKYNEQLKSKINEFTKLYGKLASECSLYY